LVSSISRCETPRGSLRLSAIATFREEMRYNKQTGRLAVTIRQIIVAMILAALIMLTTCIRPSQSTTNQTTPSVLLPTSSISPTPSPITITLPQKQSPPTTLGGPYEMPESLALSGDTIAVGTVSQGSTPTGQGNSIYSYWTFNVEEYVLQPLSDKIITI
jgi:hypothetical protein